MTILPFLGVNLYTIKLHGEVNVITSGHSGHAALAHHLASLHYVAFMHFDMAEVAVDGLQPITVIDNDAIAVDAERRCINNAAIVGCFNADMLGNGQIVSEARAIAFEIDLNQR